MDSTIDSDIDIRYELAALTNMILSSDTLSYLPDLLKPYASPRLLRSTSANFCAVARMKLAFSSRAYRIFAPTSYRLPLTLLLASPTICARIIF